MTRNYLWIQNNVHYERLKYGGSVLLLHFLLARAYACTDACVDAYVYGYASDNTIQYNTIQHSTVKNL